MEPMKLTSIALRENTMKTLDCRAHKCPHPVVETRKQLLAAPGEALTVLVGDEVARENVGRLAASQGYAVSVTPAEGGFALELTPGAAPPEPAAAGPAAGPTVVFVGAETMGSGNDELGRLLLKNFLITLLDLDDVPDALYFVNAGVKLACRGSEASRSHRAARLPRHRRRRLRPLPRLLRPQGGVGGGAGDQHVRHRPDPQQSRPGDPPLRREKHKDKGGSADQFG